MKNKNTTRILLIDNYDSFSYNLFQYIGQICMNRWGGSYAELNDMRSVKGDRYELRVIRNDELGIKSIEDISADAIIISPGPGRPSEAGICEDAIRHFAGKIPILGVCLGHQAICETFGGTITYASRLMHGKQSIVKLDTDCPLFKGMDEKIKVARYHSLAVSDNGFPDCLKVVARTDDGEIMAVEHKEYPVYGLQFHPESILTPSGMTILENFL